MSEVSDSPETKPVSAGKRVRASGPILILAAMFVAATFLAWYFTWFGRGLSDSDISEYLADTKNPRHVQHALLQVQQKMERRDPVARNWYPQIQTLSESQETEFRLTVAWIMGFDNQSSQFHDSLLRLVRDPEPIVRRNAALALVRFNDQSGREELVSVLKPFEVKATTTGAVTSSLHVGSEISRGALLVRIQESDGKVAEIRSPLPGRIEQVIRGNGSTVTQGETLLTLNSDEGSIWEALRGLSFVGTRDDLPSIQSYANSEAASDRVREQAKLAAKAIENRSN
jgi:biotin carboxyl carrier protein